MLPKTEYVGKHEVALPLHPKMTEKDVLRVITAAQEILQPRM